MSVQLPDSETPPSVAVIEAVAARECVDPTALKPPLYEAIDPDALDNLIQNHGVQSRATGPRVTFSYNGYVVRIAPEGVVSLAEME